MTSRRPQITVGGDSYEDITIQERTMSERTAKERLLHDPVGGSPHSALGIFAGGFFQVAYVTPDLESFLSTFNGDLGVDRFYVIKDAQVTDQTFRGESCDAHQD